jgi:FkbM family methyltransferase
MRCKNAGKALESAMNRRSWKKNEALMERLIAERSKANQEFFFIQIGAHDGNMDDPLSHWIARYGWSGVFVEPQSTPFERLRANYAQASQKLQFVNAAIDHQEGERLLYRVDESFVSTGEQTGLASFFPDRDLATYSALGKLKAEKIRCITFPQLLAEANVQRVDLLQIDTEGYDFEIIKMVDFTKLKPALIQYEHRVLSGQEHRECRRLLKHHGYAVYELPFDDLAVYGR